MSSPYFVWTPLVDNNIDPYKRSSIGSLRTKSKHLGDGGWCVGCLKNGLYEWLSNDFVSAEGVVCPSCKSKPEIVNEP